MKQQRVPRRPLVLNTSSPFIKGFRVDISSRCKKPVPFPSPEIFRNLAFFVLSSEKVRNALVSIQLVDDKSIKKLNFSYKGLKVPTDVLSFDLSPGRPDSVFADIVVSVDTALRQARRLGVDPREEIYRYVIHGLLHVLKYDDMTLLKRRRMWKRQEVLLKKFITTGFRL